MTNNRTRMALALTMLVVFACAQASTAISWAQQPAQNSSAMPLQMQQAMVNQYCVGCHNDRIKSAGFSFASLDLARPAEHAAELEKVLLKLRTGMMPPTGRPRPDAATRKAFMASVEGEIDRIAAGNPNPGRPSLHRLNRTEYGNAIYDLLGIEVNAESLLPPDDMSHGFDNMSEVLSVTPSLIDAYIRAAGKIGRIALGDPQMKPAVELYPIRQNMQQSDYVPGTPLGTRGGIAILHNFPADASYIFEVSFFPTAHPGGLTSYGIRFDDERRERVVIAVNGEPVAVVDAPKGIAAQTPPIPVKAGPQRISASFTKSFSLTDGPWEDLLRPRGRLLSDLYYPVGITAFPHIRDFGVKGPFDASGVSETPFRRKIFSCRPVNAAEETPCAQKIITTLARQAFRKPVSAEHLEELMSGYRAGRSGGRDFESGILVALQLILSHPEFIFRIEHDPPKVAAGTVYRVSDLELASRLSYFLWSRGPDEQLIQLAAEGKLKNAAVLEQQVGRMLADPRAEALAKNFAGQWLYVRNLKDSEPDYYVYPNASTNLIQAMQHETELFFASMVRENRSVLDLLTADYTFVNEILARHYKIPNVLGDHFRRVTVADENRRGLLGQGSFLTVTSLANRTSPVIRGKWILEQVLGAPAPVPPPAVPALKEIGIQGGEIVKPATVRERMEEHRKSEPCHSCHQIMDPLGLALENFDAIGAWRTKDEGLPVDPSGQLADGTLVNSPTTLRQALLDRSDAVTLNIIAKLLTYALGRGVDYYDMPAVRSIDRQAAETNYRFQSIVMGIVQSLPFQMKKAVEQPAATAGKD